jgi:hypothetical protein
MQLRLALKKTAFNRRSALLRTEGLGAITVLPKLWITIANAKAATTPQPAG